MIGQLTLCSQLAFSQYSEKIGSARPGESVGSGVVGARVIQLQQGMYSSRFVGFSDPKFYGINNVARYGLGDRVEISGLFNYDLFSDAFGSSAATAFWQLGGRYRITADEGAIPRIAFQTRAGHNKGVFSATSMILMTKTLTDKFGLTSNLIFRYSDLINKVNFGYTFNIGYSISDRWETFIEAYDTPVQGSEIPNFDTGLGFYATNNLKFDIAYAHEFKPERNTISGGLSYRFRHSKKE